MYKTDVLTTINDGVNTFSSIFRSSDMDSEAFLLRLDTHRQGGRITDESYANIAAHERNSEAPNPVIIETATTDHTADGPYLFRKAYNMKFSLGVAAAIGATLVLVGTALLCVLIEDAIDVEVFFPFFGVITLAAYFAPASKLEGRAKDFVSEARSILFAVGFLISTLYFLFEILEWDDGSDFPGNLRNLLPVLGVVLFASHFARQMDAYVSHYTSWGLWFVPLAFVFTGSDSGTAFSLTIVIAALVAEVVWEWLSDTRPSSSGVQATMQGMMLGIIAWISLYVYGDWLNNDSIYPVLLIVGWFVVAELTKHERWARFYPTGGNKGWLPVLFVLVFFTGLPLHMGFEISDNFGPEEIDIAGFDLELVWVYAFIIHGLMGLQAFDWKPGDVVGKPSLSEPRTNYGSIFFLMAFVWFVIGTIDFLEDFGAYLFLPLGFFVLAFGTWRLIRSSSKSPTEDQGPSA